MNPPRTTKGFRWLALIVALVAVTALVGYVASRRPAPPVSNLPPSRGPWTVDGLKLGMTLAECEAVLGKPTRTSVAPKGLVAEAWFGNPPATMIHFNPPYNPEPTRLNFVMGSTLREADGRIVLSPTSNEADVRAVLPDAAPQEQWEPALMGLTSRRTGLSFTLRRPPFQYHLGVDNGKLSSISLMPLVPADDNMPPTTGS